MHSQRWSTVSSAPGTYGEVLPRHVSWDGGVVARKSALRPIDRALRNPAIAPPVSYHEIIPWYEVDAPNG